MKFKIQHPSKIVKVSAEYTLILS